MELVDFTDDELERIAARKEMERENEKKEIERLEKLQEMPFYLMIQEKGQEEILKRVEFNQKDVFMKYSVKKWGVKKEDALELFQEYFTEFLNGKSKSIREFMFKKGYKYDEMDPKYQPILR